MSTEHWDRLTRSGQTNMFQMLQLVGPGPIPKPNPDTFLPFSFSLLKPGKSKIKDGPARLRELFSSHLLAGNGGTSAVGNTPENKSLRLFLIWFSTSGPGVSLLRTSPCLFPVVSQNTFQAGTEPAKGP